MTLTSGVGGTPALWLPAGLKGMRLAQRPRRGRSGGNCVVDPARGKPYFLKT